MEPEQSSQWPASEASFPLSESRPQSSDALVLAPLPGPAVGEADNPILGSPPDAVPASQPAPNQSQAVDETPAPPPPQTTCPANPTDSQQQTEQRMQQYQEWEQAAKTAGVGRDEIAFAQSFYPGLSPSEALRRAKLDPRYPGCDSQHANNCSPPLPPQPAHKPGILDVALPLLSMLPVVGPIFGGAECAYDLYKGDMTGAALSCTAALTGGLAGVAKAAHAAHGVVGGMEIVERGTGRNAPTARGRVGVNSSVSRKEKGKSTHASRTTLTGAGNIQAEDHFSSE